MFDWKGINFMPWKPRFNFCHQHLLCILVHILYNMNICKLYVQVYTYVHRQVGGSIGGLQVRRCFAVLTIYLFTIYLPITYQPIHVSSVKICEINIFANLFFDLQKLSFLTLFLLEACLKSLGYGLYQFINYDIITI